MAVYQQASLHPWDQLKNHSRYKILQLVVSLFQDHISAVGWIRKFLNFQLIHNQICETILLKMENGLKYTIDTSNYAMKLLLL